MFANYSKLVFACAAALLVGVYSTPSMAYQKHVDKSCDGDDCSITLPAQPYAKFCDSQYILAFWNRRRSDYMMVQCPCDCTMESNTNWLINGRNGGIYALGSGRFILNSFFAGAPAKTEVPDRFGSTKFCNAPRKDKLEGSLFVLLFKHPYNDSFPYCYEIGYVSLKNGKFSIQGDSGKIPSSNRDYWLKSVSNSEKNSLLSIWRMTVRRN